MSIDKIKQKLFQDAVKDSSWLEKAKWRSENEDWLAISFEIALRVGSTLSANKKAEKFPKNQIELARAVDCSPQYISKMLKGQERLQIDTICKIGKVLGIKLIEVPQVQSKSTEYNVSVWTDILKMFSKSTPIHTSVAYSTELIVEEVMVAVESAGENNYGLAA